MIRVVDDNITSSANSRIFDRKEPIAKRNNEKKKVFSQRREKKAFTIDMDVRFHVFQTDQCILTGSTRANHIGFLNMNII